MPIYAQRRQRLLDVMQPHSLAILGAASISFRNNDSEFPFRQDSDFYYLSGFKEPEAIAVLIKDAKDSRFLLFVRPRAASEEQWTGPRLGTEGAKSVLGADEAYAVEEFATLLPTLLENKQILYHSLGIKPALDSTVTQSLKALHHKASKGLVYPQQICELLPFIHQLRLYKSSEEILLLKKAASISALAHKSLMQQCSKLQYEYELEALFQYECQKAGCKALAYSTIVGSGANACILHYTDNSQVLQKDQLVLVDAGGEYDYYAADITRSYPANGHFSPAQKAIYQLVLDAQLAAIEVCRPGVLWSEMQQRILAVMLPGLVALGLLKGTVSELISSKAYQRFYMHSSGHWLGLDVHDRGTYVQDGVERTLQPGMVFTIEPGIYIAANQADIDPKWWGIGVRIEDDILITQEGCEVLSKEAPKTVADIEAIMQYTL